MFLVCYSQWTLVKPCFAGVLCSAAAYEQYVQFDFNCNSNLFNLKHHKSYLTSSSSEAKLSSLALAPLLPANKSARPLYNLLTTCNPVYTLLCHLRYEAQAIFLNPAASSILSFISSSLFAYSSLSMPSTLLALIQAEPIYRQQEDSG